MCLAATVLGADPGSSSVTADASAADFTRLYETASRAVVGVRCQTDEGAYSGTGTIVDPDGLVLTSTTVVPTGAHGIEIYLTGGQKTGADLLETAPEREFSLLRIRADDLLRARGDAAKAPATFPFVPLGNSSAIHIGQPTLSLGNAFNSIIRDDQVTVAAGIVSGRYVLDSQDRSRRSYRTLAASSDESAGPDSAVSPLYVGPVIETTSHVNDYMDGGPLLDREGRLVGILSLHVSRDRWLGTAIPVNLLKPLFGVHRPWYSDRARPGDLYLGLELSETGRSGSGERRLRIDHVFAGSPAADAGVRRDQLLLGVDGQPVSTVDDLRTLLQAARSASSLRLLLAETDPEDADPSMPGEVLVRCWARF